MKMSSKTDLFSINVSRDHRDQLELFKLRDIVNVNFIKDEITCKLKNDQEIKLKYTSSNIIDYFKENDFVSISENCLINLRQIRSIKNFEDECILTTVNGAVYHVKSNFKQLVNILNCQK